MSNNNSLRLCEVNSIVRTVMFQNAGAVEHMLMGDFELAASMFQKSMAAVEFALRYDHQVDRDAHTLDTRRDKSTMVLSSCSVPSGLSESSSFAVFGECFLLDLSNPCATVFRTGDLQLLQVILGFNLGLAYHAMHCPDLARHQYQTMARLAQGLDFSLWTENVKVIALAAANNLAALSLDHYCDVPSFEHYHTILGFLTASTMTSKCSWATFFTQNLHFNVHVRGRPAQAA